MGIIQFNERRGDRLGNKEALRLSVQEERAAAFTNMRVALITASHALMRASIEIEQEEAVGHTPEDAAVVARLSAYRTYFALNYALPMPRAEDPTVIPQSQTFEA